jgi:quinol monooxygenase YgiN
MMRTQEPVIRLALTLVAHRGQLKELATELRVLMGQTLGKPGLVDCQLSIDFVDPHRLHYAEEWRSERDLKNQIPSERFHRLIALLEAAAERPRFDVQLIIRSDGLDFVEEALRRQS